MGTTGVLLGGRLPLHTILFLTGLQLLVLDKIFFRTDEGEATRDDLMEVFNGDEIGLSGERGALGTSLDGE